VGLCATKRSGHRRTLCVQHSLVCLIRVRGGLLRVQRRWHGNPHRWPRQSRPGAPLKPRLEPREGPREQDKWSLDRFDELFQKQNLEACLVLVFRCGERGLEYSEASTSTSISERSLFCSVEHAKMRVVQAGLEAVFAVHPPARHALEAAEVGGVTP
jgi:hypothetical protein